MQGNTSVEYLFLACLTNQSSTTYTFLLHRNQPLRCFSNKLSRSPSSNMPPTFFIQLCQSLPAQFCCQILTKCGQDPETNGLKRLLAVKKSLSEFEQRVEHVRKVNRARARLKFDWLHIWWRISGGAAFACREQRSNGPLSDQVPKMLSHQVPAT